MKKLFARLTALICFLAFVSTVQAQGPGPYIRGDINCDGLVDGPDLTYLTNYLFTGGPPPRCLSVADLNLDGSINTGDLVYLNNFLNSGGPPPPAPFPTCALAPGSCISCCRFFVRGDVTCDGVVDGADVAALSIIIPGGPPPPCQDAADINDDGVLSPLDLVQLISYVNTGGPPPSAPFPTCGFDPTPLDGLSCLTSCCRCFIRGDVNCDGVVNGADLTALTSYAFSGSPVPACLDAADVNDDGLVTPFDVVYLNSFLNAGGPAPMPPFPVCGFDPTLDGLSCISEKGDINVDIVVCNSSDVICELNCVYLGSAVSPCNCAPCLTDVNCDGILTSSDIVLELNKCFLGLVTPPWCGP